jgi:hypothetical protein
MQWWGHNSEEKTIWFFFKEKPDQDLLIQIGRLLQTLFPDCKVLLETGTYTQSN